VNIIMSYFTSEYSGGPGTNSDGAQYAALGGGIKRWRTPVVKSGRWYNVVPSADRDKHISSTDLAKIAARTGEFELLLGSSSPEAQRDALLAQIGLSRESLEQRPASCTNRQRREAAFDKLYTLMANAFGMSKSQVDRQYRTLEDYVFAELEYNQSKTCCWNATTPAMHDIVVQYNEQHIYANGSCNMPVVFKAQNGGFDVFKQYAVSIGRGSEWVDWSAGESCPQSGVSNDTEVAHRWSSFCSVADDIMDGNNGGGGNTGGAGPSGGPCNGVTWEGQCEGSTVVWCESDTIYRHSCSSSQTCAWQSGLGYYWCQ
jgi:hypothetical protein